MLSETAKEPDLLSIFEKKERGEELDLHEADLHEQRRDLYYAYLLNKSQPDGLDNEIKAELQLLASGGELPTWLSIQQKVRDRLIELGLNPTGSGQKDEFYPDEDNGARWYEYFPPPKIFEMLGGK